MRCAGYIFHASRRSATTWKEWGRSSSGRASRLVTGRNSALLVFRRRGSKRTVRPAAEGTMTIIVPMATARTFLKKVRRSSERGGCVAVSAMGRGFYGGLRVRYKWAAAALEHGRVRMYHCIDQQLR